MTSILLNVGDPEAEIIPPKLSSFNRTSCNTVSCVGRSASTTVTITKESCHVIL